VNVIGPYNRNSSICGWSVPLTCITRFGYVPLSQTGAELLFEVFSQRYERSG
jgi:hypothetical protein